MEEKLNHHQQIYNHFCFVGVELSLKMKNKNCKNRFKV